MKQKATGWFSEYAVTEHFDEMLSGDGECRPHYQAFMNKLATFSHKKLVQLQHSTDKAQVSMGMTFNVYHDNKGVEKILPLDLIPRIITGKEWAVIEKGLEQRILALNLFIQDIYNDQKILKDKVIPKGLLLSSKDYLKPCQGLNPPNGIWCHITGSDIVRDNKGNFMVLEDNLRCPSGVSYMLENREIVKQAFPNLFTQLGVQPVANYSGSLLHIL